MRYLIALLLLCLPVWGVDTGWVLASAGANVDNAGNTAWTNTGNITADDGSNATCAPPGNAGTDLLRATFNLSALIPVGAYIDGVEVRYQASRGSSGPEEDNCRLVVGGTAVGLDHGVGDPITSTPTDYTRGGATDMWSVSISRDQAVATDFGFQISFFDTDTGSDTVSVDAMWIKVYFTPPDIDPYPGDGTDDSAYLLNFLEE